jgi:alpha-tubulin suppressor-like RCC1 family protein
VLSLACGGSHTLAIVSESGEADAGGVAVVWGTGTVGQLGLGPGGGRSDKETAEPLVVPLLDAETGAALLARRVAAGVVSSGVVTVTGDVFALQVQHGRYFYGRVVSVEA